MLTQALALAEQQSKHMPPGSSSGCTAARDDWKARPPYSPEWLAPLVLFSIRLRREPLPPAHPDQSCFASNTANPTAIPARAMTQPMRCARFFSA